MGANAPARAATAGELLSLRGGGQTSKYYLAIQTPTTIYTARINQTFTAWDSIVELTIDGGSGTLANVKEGMTIFIGSSLGAHDKGTVRVRLAPTSTKAYIAETSDIHFMDNDYVTFVDLMPPYPRDLTVPGGVAQMDYDIVFGLQPLNPPVPVLGPLAAVIELESDGLGGYLPFDFTPPDPSDLSYSPDGATLSSYLFACPGATVTNPTTTTPTITINTPGQYRWSCQITDNQGRFSTGYRWIFANPTSPTFTADEPEGDADSGNWHFRVECHDNTDLTDIVERAMVVLYERGYYDQAREEIGPIDFYENIKCVGWIEDESIERDPEAGVVRFTVQGPAYWLEQIHALPFGVTYTSTTPTTWVEVQNLTVDKALAFLLTYCSTAAMVMDCVLTGITTRVRTVTAPPGNLWGQIKTIGDTYLFAPPRCNHYGQLFIQVDPQYLSLANRSTIPVIQNITSDDLVRGSLHFERRTVSKQSRIQLEGLGPYDGSNAPPLFSRAPGTAFKTYGSPDTPTSYIFANQDDCNYKAGCVLAVRNLEYEVSFTLAANNKLIDICPNQFLTLTVDPADTPRGITLSGARIIPRKVSYERDKESGRVHTNVTCDLEAIATNGITYYPPQAPTDNLPDVSMPDGFGDFPWDSGWFPPFTSGPLTLDNCAGNISAAGNGPYSFHWDQSLLNGNGGPLVARAYFPCIVRSAAHIYHTIVSLGQTYKGDAAAHVSVVATLGGSGVLTIPSGGGEVAPVGNVTIDGFMMTLEAGGEAASDNYMLQPGITFVVGGIVTTGSADCNDEDGITLGGLTLGNWYRLKISVPSVGADATFQAALSAGGWAAGYMGNRNIGGDVFYYDGRPDWIRFSSNGPGPGVNRYACYFQAITASIYVRHYEIDGVWTGALGAHVFEIRDATPAAVRQVILHAGAIQNVCAVV